MPGKGARRFYFPVADVNWFILPPTHQVCSRPHAFPGREETRGHRVLHLKAEGGLPSRAPPPLPSNSVHPTWSLSLSFSFGTRLSLSPLHTFPPSIFRSKINKAQLPAWGESHGRVRRGREGRENPRRRGMRGKLGRTDVPGALGPPLARPRKPLLSPAPAELHYFLPGPIIFLQKKKNLKKYKLLLCEIKVPLSGASG